MTDLDMETEAYCRDLAAREQPRPALDKATRCRLPSADPHYQQQSSLFALLNQDCRNLIWEHVLRHEYTRIERWRNPDMPPIAEYDPTIYDAECFPYRMTGTERGQNDMPLNLLLGCRQIYLECLPTLYSTTFVFENPQDLHTFQLTASPEGLSAVKRITIAFLNINRRPSGTWNPLEVSPAWEPALDGLKTMQRLHELHIWFGNGLVPEFEFKQRPWGEEQGSEALEQSHERLFELLGGVEVGCFTVHLTWHPRDVLRRRSWPFRVELVTMRKMRDVLDGVLPRKRFSQLSFIRGYHNV